MKTPQTTEIDYLGYWLKLFLGEFLTVTRNMSHNTQMSYRDTFRMLVTFVSGKTNIAIDKLNISDISKEMVLLFLDEFVEKCICFLTESTTYGHQVLCEIHSMEMP